MTAEIDLRPDRLGAIQDVNAVRAPDAAAPIDRSKLGFSTKSTIAPAKSTDQIDVFGLHSRPTLPSPNPAKGALDVCMICESMIELMTDHLKTEISIQSPVLEKLRQKKLDLIEQFAKASTEKEKWSIANQFVNLAVSATVFIAGLEMAVGEYPIIGPLIAGAEAISMTKKSIDLLKMTGLLTQQLSFLDEAAKETENTLQTSIRFLSKYSQLLEQAAHIAAISVGPNREFIQHTLQPALFMTGKLVEMRTASVNHKAAQFGAEQTRLDGLQVVQRRKMEAQMKSMADSMATLDDRIEVMEEAIVTTKKGGK